MILRDTVDDIVNYWTLNPLGTLSTDVFEGLKLRSMIILRYQSIVIQSLIGSMEMVL
ncbi:hypothetical protein Ct9H90mP12_2230 [bacterium]|nr:MAG: hypothetical protein Ct9H90mP12_2230 [bacterium]